MLMHAYADKIQEHNLNFSPPIRYFEIVI